MCKQIYYTTCQNRSKWICDPYPGTYLFSNTQEEGNHFFWKNKFATAPEFHQITQIA